MQNVKKEGGFLLNFKKFHLRSKAHIHPKIYTKCSLIFKQRTFFCVMYILGLPNLLPFLFIKIRFRVTN